MIFSFQKTAPNSFIAHIYVGATVVDGKDVKGRFMVDVPKNLPTEALANDYLQSLAFDQIWYHLEKYVHHAAAVMMHGSPAYAVKIKTALEYCITLPETVHGFNYNLPKLCALMQASETQLRQILPHPTNNSYTSSLKRLESIINTAADCLTWLNQQQAA